jgi:hypothetical protein
MRKWARNASKNQNLQKNYTCIQAKEQGALWLENLRDAEAASDIPAARLACSNGKIKCGQ